MKIVNAGSAYVDIDAYGGCIAYAELLRAQGEEAVAACSAPLNGSIPPTVRGWDVDFESSYTPQAKDQFVLVDISNPGWLDKAARLDDVVEVIDHHLEFLEFWQERPEVKVDIEHIGAACTKVYERWKAAGLLDQLSVTSARLLVCGILDNTLNFKAQITTDRDRAAYRDLMRRGDLPRDWPTQYFSECQREIEADLPRAIQNDLKGYSHVRQLPEHIGQLVIWDASTLLADRALEIVTIMNKLSPEWAMNIVSIGEGCSYFLADDPGVQASMGKLLDVSFKNGVARADRLWLRKEIVHHAKTTNPSGGKPKSGRD